MAPQETIEHPSKGAERSDNSAYAGVAAGSWNKSDMQSLTARMSNQSLPALFGNLELIAKVPAIEATMSVFKADYTAPDYIHGLEQAKNPEQYARFYTQQKEAEHLELLASNDTSKTEQKPVSGNELIEIADKLGHAPHRWESTTTGKCNLFVDAILRMGHIPLPWDGAHIPDSHGMRVALDKECQKPGSHWHKIYSYDSAHGSDSDQRFTHYQPKNADIIIWDKAFGDKWVQHSGMAVEPYDMKYAGARDHKGETPKHGIGKTDIYNFTGSRPYGSPSAVYRYEP